MKTCDSKKILAALIFICMAAPICALSEMPVKEEKTYTIGTGDRIAIQVWDHNDLNRTVEVAPDGTFTFPFIGKVIASGQSVYALEYVLTEKLSDGYLVAPQVTVNILEYHHNKVFLFGEVVHPGSYILKRDMRLLELISDAGGFTDARGSICRVVRSDENRKDDQPISLKEAAGREVITIDLNALTKGDMRQDITILPNDSIYISTAEPVYVTGEVRKPGEIEYTEGMTVRQAISLAGGGTPRAALNRIRIVRMKAGRETEIAPDLGDPVLPNDILKVPESYF